MSRFFRILAVILLIISTFFLFSGIVNIEEREALLVVFAAFGGIVSGLALHTVGDLLDRVRYLEDQLNIRMPIEKSEDNLPQVQCKKCRTKYDMDYPKCPCCGAKTEFNNDKGEK